MSKVPPLIFLRSSLELSQEIIHVVCGYGDSNYLAWSRSCGSRVTLDFMSQMLPFSQLLGRYLVYNVDKCLETITLIILLLYYR